MNKALIFFAICIVLVCFVAAAPANDNNSVQFLKYTSDADFEAIQKQIIAQYEQLGGSTEFHPEQAANYVDPQTLKINI